MLPGEHIPHLGHAILKVRATLVLHLLVFLCLERLNHPAYERHWLRLGSIAVCVFSAGLWMNLSLPKRERLNAPEIPQPNLVQDSVYSLACIESEDTYQKRIRDIDINLSNLDNPAATVNQQEEAFRSLGEFLGFAASRPDNDTDTGPDVLWVDEQEKVCLAFELKTDKDVDVYYKHDISQGHDHKEWLRANYEGYQAPGLIFIGPDGHCHPQSNPGDDMYQCKLEKAVEIRDSILAILQETRRKTPLEKISYVSTFCSSENYGTMAIFQLFAQNQLTHK